MFTIALHCQAMAQLGSKNSSRNLHMNYAIGFFFCPHLILHACVQTFDVIFCGKIFFNLNKALDTIIDFKQLFALAVCIDYIWIKK